MDPRGASHPSCSCVHQAHVTHVFQSLISCRVIIYAVSGLPLQARGLDQPGRVNNCSSRAQHRCSARGRHSALWNVHKSVILGEGSTVATKFPRSPRTQKKKESSMLTRMLLPRLSHATIPGSSNLTHHPNPAPDFARPNWCSHSWRQHHRLPGVQWTLEPSLLSVPPRPRPTPSALRLPPRPHLSLQPSSGWCSSRSTAALPGLERSPRDLLKVAITRRILSHWPQKRIPAPRQAEKASLSPLRPAILLLALLLRPPLVLRAAPVSGPVHPRFPLPRKPALATLTSHPSHSSPLTPSRRALCCCYASSHCPAPVLLRHEPWPACVCCLPTVSLPTPRPADPMSPARAGGPCLLAHPGYLVPGLLPDTQWVPNKCETESPGP